MASSFSFTGEGGTAGMATDSGSSPEQQRIAQLEEVVKLLQSRVFSLHDEAGKAVSNLEVRLAQAIKASEDKPFALKPPKPRSFSGNDKGLKVLDWLHQAEIYLRAAGIENTEQGVYHITSFLEADAATWWRFHCHQVDKGLETRLVNFAGLKQLTKKRFQVFNHETEVRDKYYALRQTSSVSAYISRFRALVVELESEPEQTQIYQFLKGLKPSVQAATRTHKPRTLRAAMDIADEADRAKQHAHKSVSWYDTVDGTGLEYSADASNGQPADGEVTAQDSSGPEPMNLGAVTARQGGRRR